MLERARIQAGMSVAQVAAHCGIHSTALRRWEKGQTGPKPADVMFLANLYRVPGEQARTWSALALKAKERGLFEAANVPAQLRVLVASEVQASTIQALELEYIPGLLQTPEYHRAIQTVELPIGQDEAESIRTVRVQRQRDVFGRVPMPRLEFIIGPAAMFYMDTWPTVRDGQIQRLREVASQPNVDIRIITGPHAGMLGSFTIVTPPKDSLTRPVAYVESVDGCRYIETTDVVSEYLRTLDAVRDQSQPIKEYLNDAR